MVLFDPSTLFAVLRVGLLLRSEPPVSDGPSIVADQSDAVPSATSSPFVTGLAYGDESLDSPSPTSPTSTVSQATSTPFSVQSEDDAACTPVPYTVAPVPIPALPSSNPALATVYRYRQQQGVNLGSWFMLEAWMVPSLFNCASTPGVSEYDVATGWNGDSKSVLERHWDTFITESDFEWLSGIGINTVRLPLGYWHVGSGETEWTTGTMYDNVRDSYTGAWPRVLRAVNWAAKHGIGVLIDLHGAPGSQNGQQHSGVSDGQTNLFSSPSNILKTVQVLEFLTTTFVNVPNIVGIQLLNEPVDVPELWDFYNAALEAVRSISPESRNFPFYLHDAFDLDKGSSYIMNRGREWNVLDHHSYYVFTPWDDAEPVAAHIVDLAESGSVGSDLMRKGTMLNGNFIIGEWSCALTDDSMSGESDPISARRQFCSIQAQTYRDVSSGSAFWSLTKEDCDQDPGWCFKSAVSNALPSSFFSFEGLTTPLSLTQAVSGNATSTSSDTIASEGNTGANSDPISPVSWAAMGSNTSPSTSTPSSNTADASTTTGSAVALQAPTSVINADLKSLSSSSIEGSSFPSASTSSVPIPKRHIGSEDGSPDSKVRPLFTGHHGRSLRAGLREHRSFAIHSKRMAERQHEVQEVMGNGQASSPSVTAADATSSPENFDSTSSALASSTSDQGETPTSTPTQVTGAAVLTPAQQAIQRGFSDGFVTAKLFAEQGPGMSRLGFKWQYVEDSLAAHGSLIQPGTEAYYREWFDKGLVQGEAMVEKVIAKMNALSEARFPV